MDLCDEGASKDFIVWDAWDDGDQEKKILDKACFQDKEAGYVYAVCGDLDWYKYNIQCINEADYIKKLFSTHESLSKW